MTTLKSQSVNAQRLRKYKAKMAQAGFKRLYVYVCPELVALLDGERQIGECGGRTLERLLLGEAARRPDYWTPEEKAKRQARAEANRRGLAQRL